MFVCDFVWNLVIKKLYRQDKTGYTFSVLLLSYLSAKCTGDYFLFSLQHMINRALMQEI